MFRMNGISRKSTRMCRAIVSIVHRLSSDVRRGCLKYALCIFEFLSNWESIGASSR